MAYGDYLVEVRELEEHLQDPDWRVVDCRFELTQPDKGFADYMAGHIPGAVYAHLDRDLAAPVTPATGRHPLPEPRSFMRTLSQLGIARDSRVVVYDQAGGAIAARLWWMLQWMGHRAVRLLDGGFAAWQRQGLPLDGGARRVEPAVEYAAEPDDSMVVTTGDIQQGIDLGAPLPLVDARDPARFAGRSEPIDPVAGHIPSARNFPFSRSLTEQGFWRSPEELRSAWAEVFGGAGAEPSEGPVAGPESGWAVMCGSGVTACHLAISAGLAGFPAPRLYAGSWSEWIRDPRRPIATDGADGPAAGGS